MEVLNTNSYHYFTVSAALWLHSPALFLNSLGVGWCDDRAAVVHHLLAEMGYTARLWSLQGHVVPEVLINGRWEVWDTDLGVYYYTR